MDLNDSIVSYRPAFTPRELNTAHTRTVFPGDTVTTLPAARTRGAVITSPSTRTNGTA